MASTEEGHVLHDSDGVVKPCGDAPARDSRRSGSTNESFDIFAASKPETPPQPPATMQPEGSCAQAKASTAEKSKARFVPSFVETSLLLYSVFYASVSRVPFTLFAIYMIDVLNFTYIVAALTLGLYCFGRLVGAHLAGMYLGSVTMIFGTASGGVAWSCILFFEQQWVFIVSSFLLGFTETVTGLDTMLKIESLILCRSPEQTQIIFRSQLICTCLGVFLAYMGGGILYQMHGMRPVGVTCIMFSCTNLVILMCLFMFPHRKIYRRTFIRLCHIMEEHNKATPAKGRKSRMSVAGKDVGGRQRVSTYNVDAIEILEDGKTSAKNAAASNTDADGSRGMKSRLFLGTVVACFFFTTLGISTQFAISALYWNRVWAVGPDVVGTIMAVGEVLGVCLLVVFAHPRVFDSALTKYFGKPANVLNATLGMGLMCYLITVDNKVACAIGSVGVHMFNVCVHSFQAELIGVCATGEEFASWISRSYVVKRLANCVCVFSSIIFFNLLGPQSSYRVIGSGLLVYAAVLCCSYAFMGILPCQIKGKETGKPAMVRTSAARTSVYPVGG